MLARGCWSEVERFGFAEVPGTGPGWTIAVDGTILLGGAPQGTLAFGQTGRYNQLNALAAFLLHLLEHFDHARPAEVLGGAVQVFDLVVQQPQVRVRLAVRGIELEGSLQQGLGCARFPAARW